MLTTYVQTIARLIARAFRMANQSPGRSCFSKHDQYLNKLDMIAAMMQRAHRYNDEYDNAIMIVSRAGEKVITARTMSERRCARACGRTAADGRTARKDDEASVKEAIARSGRCEGI